MIQNCPKNYTSCYFSSRLKWKPFWLEAEKKKTSLMVVRPWHREDSPEIAWSLAEVFPKCFEIFHKHPKHLPYVTESLVTVQSPNFEINVINAIVLSRFGSKGQEGFYECLRIVKNDSQTPRRHPEISRMFVEPSPVMLTL